MARSHAPSFCGQPGLGFVFGFGPSQRFDGRQLFERPDQVLADRGVVFDDVCSQIHSRSFMAWQGARRVLIPRKPADRSVSSCVPPTQSFCQRGGARRVGCFLRFACRHTADRSCRRTLTGQHFLTVQTCLKQAGAAPPECAHETVDPIRHDFLRHADGRRPGGLGRTCGRTRRNDGQPRAARRLLSLRRGRNADGTAWMKQQSRRRPTAIRCGSRSLAGLARTRSPHGAGARVLPLGRAARAVEPLRQRQDRRHFEITRKLDVKLGRTTRILADGIEFANPEWAADPHLVKAEGAEIDIELLPLLQTPRRPAAHRIAATAARAADRGRWAAQLGAGPRLGRPAQHTGLRRAHRRSRQRAFRGAPSTARTSGPTSPSTAP